jgi:hypothetical protein
VTRRPLMPWPLPCYGTPVRPEFERAARYFARAGSAVLRRSIRVDIAHDPGWPYLAAYNDGAAVLNVVRWPTNTGQAHLQRWVDKLLVHECAHHWSAEHTSPEFRQGCCIAAARLAEYIRLTGDRIRGTA